MTDESDQRSIGHAKDPARTLDPKRPDQGCDLAAYSLRTQQCAYAIVDERTRGSRVTSDSVLTMPLAVSGELVSVPPLSFCCVLTTSNEAVSANSSGHVPVETVYVPVLLRKEVIQPHLPVRLPCYDLVPIANPTFDGSLHKGWATGFGCYRLS